MQPVSCRHRGFKALIGSRFKMTDNGPIDSVLGIQIAYDRERRTIKLFQEGFAKAVLARFGMDKSKPIATPLVPHAPLATLDEAGEAIPTNISWYQSVVGSLMYLCIGTRPDLAFAVGTLAKFMSAPSEHHAIAAKRVLRYLSGTQDLGLTYNGNRKDLDVLTGYSDADYAQDINTRKSTTGLCFMMNGAAISWTSKPSQVQLPRPSTLHSSPPHRTACASANSSPTSALTVQQRRSSRTTSQPSTSRPTR
jgi:hypothetical protein